MSGVIKDNITRPPSYAVEKNMVNGREEYTVYYSVQIDGKEYRSQSRATGPNAEVAEAKAARRAQQNLARKIENDYEEQASKITSSSSDKLESFLGAESLQSAKREEPNDIIVRQNRGQSNLSEDQNQSGINLNSVQELSELGDKESKIIETVQNSPESLSKRVHHRSEKQKNHVPWPIVSNRKADGRGPEGILKEPVPEYFTRPDEEVIKGPNNTIIVLGRDRAPTNEMTFSPHVEKRNYKSGYSDYMGAGAIDIVVGRMAPYPVDQMKGLGGKFKLAPMFNTLEGQGAAKLQGIQLEAGEHPGIAMDAARIYISQMTDVDENFGITQSVSTTGIPQFDPLDFRSDKKKVVPTSAIVLKADKLRFHSRQDIKIVTGGQKELYNSQGNRITTNSGIHLIAENGLDKNLKPLPQQPMVLGNNLVRVLEFYGLLIEDAVQTMDAMAQTQMMFNQVIATNFDLLPIPSATTIPNPFKQLAGIVTQINLVLRRFDAIKQLINNFSAKTNYLTPSAQGENYILSRFNTVN